jgi:ATP adenylyltransferase
VPRWNGDANFMPIVGGTKLIPEALDQTYTKLKPLFDELK